MIESPPSQPPRHLIKDPAVFVAIITLIGGVISISYQSCANRDLENQRFQSELILQSIQTGDKNQALANLKFISRLGLFDPTRRSQIDSLDMRTELDSSLIPVLPAASQGGGMSPGTPVVLRLRLSYQAVISYSRVITPDLIDTSPGVMGPGDTLFLLPYGGTLMVYARNLSSNETESIPVDCTRSARCQASF